MINRRIFYSPTLFIPRGQAASILLPLLLDSCLLEEISPFTFLRHFYRENPKRFFVLQILDAKPKFFVICLQFPYGTICSDIRFYLKSPRLFDRIRLFEISFESPRFEAWKSCFDDVSLGIEAKGGKGGWKVKARIELASSIGHLSGAKILRTGIERIVSMDFFSPRFCAFFILNSPRNVT